MEGDHPRWKYIVADYECSIGVVGTWFLRAPEILQIYKERKLSKNLEVFSKTAHIYSYGMTCYEILIRKFPFEGHSSGDYDLAFRGECPVVPEYVKVWTHDLLNMCWKSNPIARPTIQKVLNFISRNSAFVREYEEKLVREYGENFRTWYHTKILD